MASGANASTSIAAGSLTTSVARGTVTEGLPAKVSGVTVPGTIAAPAARRAMVAGRR